VAAYHTPGRRDTRFLNGRTVLAAFHRALDGSAPGEWLPEFPPVTRGGSGLIQVAPDNLLEELPASKWTVKDLGQVDFHLSDGQLPVVDVWHNDSD
jgi:hypothetical protein